MIQQFHLDIFERYHKRGLEAYRGGDMATAKRSFLKAAEVLFKLAADSAGELQRVRKEKAGKLLALAQSIDPSVKGVPAAPSPRKSSVASEDGGEGEEGGQQWIVTTVPDIKMDEVAGLEEVKAIIRKRVVYPFQHPEITKKYHKQAGGGVLLYGPPGTGKTMIAKAIANEIDATFFSVKCSDIMTKWVGEAERNLKKLFDAAREHPRAVVFMDETEAIVAKRGNDSTVMNRVIPEFLAQVDGLEGRHGGLLLLGATNRPWDMDEAALRPGRFGELIYVPLPDVAARRQIVAGAIKGIPMAPEVDIEVLATQTDGYSGADIVGLCERAKDCPYEREILTQVPQRLEVEDLAEARRGVGPSVTAAHLAKFEKFKRERSGSPQ